MAHGACPALDVGSHHQANRARAWMFEKVHFSCLLHVFILLVLSLNSQNKVHY